MKVDKNWAKEKLRKNPISKKKEKEVSTPSVVEWKKFNNSSETNVSVFTKTTNPKIIVKSENVKNDYDISYQNWNKHKLLKFICGMILCIIILMTFFLSLRTYNIINELSYYIMQP